VLLAIVLDRLTESFGVKAKKKNARPAARAGKAGPQGAART